MKEGHLIQANITFSFSGAFVWEGEGRLQDQPLPLPKPQIKINKQSVITERTQETGNIKDEFSIQGGEIDLSSSRKKFRNVITVEYGQFPPQ